MKSKHIVLSILLTFAFYLFPSSAQAQTCTTQYGGDVTCVPTDLTINKQVAEPVVDSKGGVTPSSVFVENLRTTQAYTPGVEVPFRISVTNASGQTFITVTIKDVLPSYLTFVSGPGSYDSGSRTLTVTLDNVVANETRSFEILTMVVDATQFAANQNVSCVTNYAEARAMDRFDSDTAQLCFQAAQNLPVAGYNDLLLLLPFAGVGLAGLVLLRRRPELVEGKKSSEPKARP